MDDLLIDSHKLIYHPKKVSDFIDGKNIYPVYIEASPSGGCNHRCQMCALDFMGYKPKFYDYSKWVRILDQFNNCDIKSIMYAGEGEPFLHPRFTDIVRETYYNGIGVAITTNGVLFTEKTHDILEFTEWIKVSINAGTKETYSKIHGCDEKDFGIVLNNLKNAVKVKKNCVIGAQSILLPENLFEMVELAKKLRDIGVEYLVIKPYSQHPSSKTTKYSDIEYGDCEGMEHNLSKLNTDSFKTIFRSSAMRKWDEKKRPYKVCQALPFWCYVDSQGGVWGCSACMPNEQFYYGNVFQTRFKDIWNSKERLRKIKCVDVDDCRVNCRMDEVNRYLWKLTVEPPKHVNFI